MTLARRIFVSMPADQWLNKKENDLKWGIVDRIEALGYATEVFFDPRGKPSLAGDKAWSAIEADKVLRHCMGAALIGMPRWNFSTPKGKVSLPTEYCHYEGAVAYTLRLPLLVLVKEDVFRRVVFDQNYKGYYFINAKGKDHVLIVLEKNAKMPADLGGDIYASLDEIKDKKKPNIASIKGTIRNFVNAL